MYAVNVFSCLTKSFSTKVRSITSLLKYTQQKSYKTKQPSIHLKTQVENDVTLFQLENPHFFIVVNLFSATQCVFWTYIRFFFKWEVQESASHNDSKDHLSKNLANVRKYENILSIIVVILAWAMFPATLMYSFRSIRKIILHKGGRNVTIITYNLPGFNKITIPLSNMTSTEHRVDAKKFIPIKIKNKYLYYLIDVRGEFLNPTLFDITAGVKRSI